MTISIITSIIVWAITGALGAVVTYLGMRYKKVVKENDALKNGMTIENEKEIDEMSATEMLVRSIREYLKKCKSLDELDEFLANLLAKKEK